MKTLPQRLLSCLLGVSLFSSGASAEVSTGILAPYEFKPTGTITESHLETLFVRHNVGEPGVDLIEARLTKKLRVTIKADLSGVDITQFNAATPIFLSVGNYGYSGTLSSDFRYTPGKKSVRILFEEDTEFKTVKTGSISFAWTEKMLTVSLTLTPYAEVGAIAPDLLGDAPTPNQRFATTGKANVTVGIANRTGTRTFFYKASLFNTEKSLKVSGVPTPGMCYSASLTGSFDTKAPALKSKFPATLTPGPADLRLEFTETDLLRDARLGVDGVTGTYTSIPVQNTPGSHFVQINGLQLSPGIRKLALSVRDESGNINIIKKTVTVAP